MTVKRLRAYPSPEELAGMYPEPHKHDVFPDHLERVKQTTAAGVVAARMLLDDEGVPISIADLSCGDAAIAKGIANRFPQGEVHLFLGDLAPGYPNEGPIEETAPNLPEIVDLFVCCETLEHVEEPVGVLRAIRRKTRLLLLTTPIDALEDDNPEHVWAWSQLGVEELLATAGFVAYHFETIDMRPQGFPYCWGLWVCA